MIGIAPICRLLVGGLLTAVITLAAALPAAAGGQKIYIDPDTGAVIGAPHRTRRSGRADTERTDSARRKTAPRRGRAKAGKTPGGAQMPASGLDKAPSARVVRCPDGSLRMGHARAKPGETARAALCARPLR